jgi:EpsI family protein
MAPNKPFFVSIFILIMTIILILAINHRGIPGVIRTNLENIPVKIGEYEGSEDFFDQSVYTELNADFHLYRHYRSPEGYQVDLYIGYYGTAKGGRTGHNPGACLPGAGWGIIKDEVVPFQIHGNQEIKVHLVVAQRGDTYNTLLHWYQSDKNKILSNGVQQNIQRFISRIFYNRNDGAFVRVSVLSRHDGLDQAKKDVKSFAEKILTLLPNYWPEEQ